MNLRPAFGLVTLAFAAASECPAATIEHDLGYNLHYLRATTLTPTDIESISTALKTFPALVLDLRANPATDETAAAQLLDTIRKTTAPNHSTRLLLLNSYTSPAIIAATTKPITGVLTLSPEPAALTADISIAITNEADLAAYKALSNGTALEKLLSTNPEKTRYDEASLVRDHANGINRAAKLDDAEPDAAEIEPTTAQEAAKAEAAAPSDLVLQRAVQIHRSLLALKKL